MPTELSHESLNVYRFYLDAVSICKDISPNAGEPIIAQDHLDRAMESVGINLMRANVQDLGSRRRSSFLDMAIASTHECAASLDVCRAKQAIEQERYGAGMRKLWRIRGMLIGLKRKDANSFAENQAEYGIPKFPHANLEMYMIAVEGVRWTHDLLKELSPKMRTRQKLDVSTTGTVLNIAEGCGRINKPDQNRFMKTAIEHAFQTVLQLDLMHARHDTIESRVAQGIDMQTKIISKMYAWCKKNEPEQQCGNTENK